VEVFLIRKSRKGLLGEARYYLGLYASKLLNRPLVAPYQAVCYVTESCNSRCSMCDVWKKEKDSTCPAPTSMYGARDPQAAVLTLEEYERLFDEFRELGVQEVILSGGEPLLRKDLCAIIGKAAKRGLTTVVLSNGLILSAAWAQDLAEAGVSCVGLSLDGSDAGTNARIRGRDDAWDRTLKAVKHLSKAGVPVAMNTTIQPENVSQLVDIHNLYLELGVAHVTFTPAHDHWFSSNSKITRTEDGTRAHRILKDQIEELRGLKKTAGLIRNSDLFLRRIPAFAASEGFSNVTCYLDFLRFTVWADGTVSFCTDGFTIGNVRSAPLKDLLRSEVAAEKRRKVRKGQCPPCWLGCFAEINILFSPGHAVRRKLGKVLGLSKEQAGAVYS
jgi:MoaA/NifB/PqqE/SkfB family radical SAM enzyme